MYQLRSIGTPDPNKKNRYRGNLCKMAAFQHGLVGQRVRETKQPSPTAQESPSGTHLMIVS